MARCYERVSLILLRFDQAVIEVLLSLQAYHLPATQLLQEALCIDYHVWQEFCYQEPHNQETFNGPAW